MGIVDDLQEAARLLRARAEAAIDIEGERWLVDQSDHGLVVGVYAPGDVQEDGSISTSVVASLAYTDDEEFRAPGRALPDASHIAALDPAVGLALASWLDRAVAAAAHLDEQEFAGRYPAEVSFVRTYLRRES